MQRSRGQGSRPGDVRAGSAMSDPTLPHCERCAGRPGSDDAIADGCRCPVLDSGHGHADWVVIAGDCPLHGFTVEVGDD